LQTVAAAYHVPVWSLIQINRKPETAALSEGERIVVPRYLVPKGVSSPATSPPPAGR
jgi:hypothetical protein